GFDEEPQPAPPRLEIPGCRVVPLGVSPSVQQTIQIINGQTTQSRQVTFVFRYRVEAQAPGTYRVPALTVTQGNRRASSAPANVQVGAVSTTPDMRIRLTLPERPVWIGEVFDVTLDWYLRR